MNIIAVILGVIAVGAGIAGFIMEHSDSNDNNKNNTQNN